MHFQVLLNIQRILMAENTDLSVVVAALNLKAAMLSATWISDNQMRVIFM
jgi:hypothetical protein